LKENPRIVPGTPEPTRFHWAGLNAYRSVASHRMGRVFRRWVGDDSRMTHKG
jgi:hypothetical protein